MKNSNIPLLKHIPNFLDYCEVEKGLANNTQENYQRYLNKFICWLKSKNLENIKPHELTSDHIWEYRLYLSRHIDPSNGKTLKKTTQNYYLIALRGFLSYFSLKDIITLPADKIVLPKADKSEKIVKFLGLEQMEKLLLAPATDNISGIRDRAILEVLFSTGLRIAELTSLNVDQFSNIKNKNDLEISIVGKGDYQRTVYFSERALNWLKKYLSGRQDKEKPLFIHYRTRKDADSRLSRRSIERIVKRYAIMAGVPIFTTPHTLRHSYATDLLTQGVDLRVIQEFLGHRSITSTQIYTHITNKRLRDIHREFHSGKNLKE
jgi:site-specific recombinase XerD